jgi:hypothetical protein
MEHVSVFAMIQLLLEHSNVMMAIISMEMAAMLIAQSAIAMDAHPLLLTSIQIQVCVLQVAQLVILLI